ncbi:MAG: 4Fe-4S ferredoxin [Ilumatobacteraceae bacterium]
MARTDANPPMMPYTDAYQLVEVDADYLSKAVKPKQFIHIDQTECIMCEGCVDICPWKCIHMVAPEIISEATGNRTAGHRPVRQRRVHRRRHLHPLRLCVDRCPTGGSSSARSGHPTPTATRTSAPQPRLRLRHA